MTEPRSSSFSAVDAAETIYDALGQLKGNRVEDFPGESQEYTEVAAKAAQSLVERIDWLERKIEDIKASVQEMENSKTEDVRWWSGDLLGVIGAVDA